MKDENLKKYFNRISNLIVIDFYGILLCTVGINIFTNLLFSNVQTNLDNNLLKFLGLALIISGILISVCRIDFSIIQKFIIDEANLPDKAYTSVEADTLKKRKPKIVTELILFCLGLIVGTGAVIFFVYSVYMDY